MQKKLIFPLILILTCCAQKPVTIASCEGRDWFEIGRQDGSFGRASQPPTEIAPECSVKEIDDQAYRLGREAGLLDFCTPDRGFQLGRAGENYHGTCPKNLEEDFLKAYRQGLIVYGLAKDNEKIGNQLDRLSIQLGVKQLSAQDKKNLENQFLNLKQKRNENLNSISQIESDIGTNL